MNGELTTNLKPSIKYDVCLTEKGRPATNRIIEVDAVPTAEETVWSDVWRRRRPKGQRATNRIVEVDAVPTAEVTFPAIDEDDRVAQRQRQRDHTGSDS